MPGPSDPGFDTLAVQAGAAPDRAGGACALPIDPTTRRGLDGAGGAAAPFDPERRGEVDGRIGDAATAALEQRIAALEGGIGAIATASGPAALHLAVATIAGAGCHLVASDALRGGARKLLAFTLPRFGIETTFVAPGDLDAWRAAIRPNTRLLFAETLADPGLDVLDIAAVAAVAHDAGLPLVVDSTRTTPWLVKPFEHGADLVVHSATEFLSGDGSVVGGLLVDGGSFDWEASGRFPELTEPCAGFRGVVFTEESTVGAFLLRARHEGLRDFGAGLSAHGAWRILQGLQTLPLRMARHVDNARRVAEFLAAQPGVERVRHPALADHPSHALAKRLLPRGCAAAFPVDLRGTRRQGQAFCEALRLFSRLADAGDCRSRASHPASTTHCRVDDAALAAAGIAPATVRLSIGLEDPADLVEDLKRALKAAERAA